MKKPKLVVILGPTATGKSDLAVAMAKKCNGEIISADSRQVYRGLDLGSGKITKAEMKGIPHHLLDVADPKKVFSVAQFQKQALKAIKEIVKRGHIPILCGGSGFYIQSIVDGIVLPEVKPNKELRRNLESKSTQELFTLLMNIDYERAALVDPSNPVRLIRAIEIATALGKVPKLVASPQFDTLQIGIDWGDEVLKARIKKRLLKRLRLGMVDEVRKLQEKGLSYRRLEDLGLEYRFIALYLQNKLGKKEMIETLAIEIWHYVKRQRTWFKRDKRIKWFKPDELKKMEGEIKGFLK